MHSWQTSLHYYLRVPRINKKNTQGLLQDFQKPLSSVPLFGLAKYFWIVLLSQSNWKQKPSRRYVPSVEMQISADSVTLTLTQNLNPNPNANSVGTILLEKET